MLFRLAIHLPIHPFEHIGVLYSGVLLRQRRTRPYQLRGALLLTSEGAALTVVFKLVRMKLHSTGVQHLAPIFKGWLLLSPPPTTQNKFTLAGTNYLRLVDSTLRWAPSDAARSLSGLAGLEALGQTFQHRAL